VTWHNEGRARVHNYQFNTKQKDQMFCPKCGASIGIDFREVHSPQVYGMSVSPLFPLFLVTVVFLLSVFTVSVPCPCIMNRCHASLAECRQLQARTIYGVNVNSLTYRELDGMQSVKPAGDLSGHWWEEEKQEMK
jgi:hypothetical protein